MVQFRKTTDRAEKEGNGYSKPSRKPIILEEDETFRVRLVTEYTKISEHKFDKVKSIHRGFPLLCLKTLNEECPICEYIKENKIKKEDDKEAYNKYISFLPKDTFYFNAINRTKLKQLLKAQEAGKIEDITQEIQVEAIAASFYQFNELKKISGIWGNWVWDPDNGLDLKMYKEKGTSDNIMLVKYRPMDMQKNEETDKEEYPLDKTYPITKLERKLSGYFAQNDVDEKNNDYANEKEVISLFCYQNKDEDYSDAIIQMGYELGLSSKSTSSSVKNKDKRSSADSEEEFEEYVKPSKKKSFDDDDDDEGRPFKKSMAKKPIDDDEDDESPPPKKKVEEKPSKKHDDDEDDEPVSKPAKKKSFDDDDDFESVREVPVKKPAKKIISDDDIPF